MFRCLRVAASSLAVVLGLTGCNMVPVGFQDPAAQAEAMAAFRAGQAGFACGQGLQCAVRWSAAKQAASRLAQAERWDDVANVVLSAGYEQDLTWFYLGLAAEGMGQTQAARIYYDNSVRRSLYGAGYSCLAAGMMSCDGIRLPEDAQHMLAGLDSRGRAPARRVAANPAARYSGPRATAVSAQAGIGAQAYAQNLARLRGEEEARRAGPDAQPRQTAQAAPAGACPTNFRC